jgi:Glycosyl transferase family 2
VIATLPVSVIIPAYDRAEMLRRSLASIAVQTVAPDEVIVVDDGSRDDTQHVARSLGARVIRHEQNRGLSAARNTGLSAAANSWVALLDSDDEWLPHHLGHIWQLRGDHVLVAASALNCGEDPDRYRFCGPVSAGPAILTRGDQLIFPGNSIPVSASMFRRDVALELGGFRPHRGVVEDFDLWLRLLERGTAICSPTVSVIYHVHDGQMSLADRRVMQLAHIEASEAHRQRTDGARAPITRWEGVAAWDNLRRAVEARKPLAGARWLAHIARHPQRAFGVSTIWVRRLRVRRRSAELRRAGVGPALAREGEVRRIEVRADASASLSATESLLVRNAIQPETSRASAEETAGEVLMASAQLVGAPASPAIHSSNGQAPPPETVGSVLLRALRRYRVLVLLCSVALAGGGAAWGLTRAPVYSASSTLQVGKVNPNSPGFYGFVQSATALATAFSRSVEAEAVLSAVHGHLGLAPTETLERLSAEPIPNSPVFRVIATGTSARGAIALANVASAAVVQYVNSSGANTSGPGLLSSYHAVAAKLARAQADAEAAARVFKAHPSPGTGAALIDARALVSAEKLRAQAIASGYQESEQGATSTSLVSLLAGASSASSDRASKVELYAFTGLLAGFVIGCLLALALERRRSALAPA